ncbi:catalase [Bacillus aerophilus]|nr:catalase [Bacillus aerophilus]
MTNSNHKNLTTNQGVPVGDNQNSRTAGHRGPSFLDDYHLIEKLAHFDRERIPERVVHARGAGAYGVFEVENSMEKHTRAAFLSEEGKQTDVFVRFSTVIHPKGSPETLRDPRGFAVKFYTEEGNYDLVGNNLPIFFIRDALKFPDMVHSLKPDPVTNIQDPDRYWDFMTLTPESTHMLTWLFSDEGIPANYAEMRGSGVHTFRWVNKYGETKYVKYHWRPSERIRNLSMEEAAEIQANDFQHATRDLYDRIEKGNYPAWDLYVQLMPLSDYDELDYDPCDPTKTWSEEDYPLQKVGRMTLNRNPENFFAETEQSAFTPSALVPGIEASEDKLLQGRLFSYPDTQRHRLGANYMRIPVNCPYAPVHNNQQDGFMTTTRPSGHINYEPNRYDDQPKENPHYKESEPVLHGDRIVRQKIEKPNDFKQAGEKYRSYSEEEKQALIKNLTADLKDVNEKTKLLAICNFYRADEDYGQRLADSLGVDIRSYLQGSMK